MIYISNPPIPFASEGQCNHGKAHPASPKPPCGCEAYGPWHPYYYTKYPNGNREVRINEVERARCGGSSLVSSKNHMQIRERPDGTTFHWYDPFSEDTV